MNSTDTAQSVLRHLNKAVLVALLVARSARVRIRTDDHGC